MVQTFKLLAIAESGLVATGSGALSFIRRRRSDGFYWNGAAFEVFTAANIANYGILSSGVGVGTGQYETVDPIPTVEGDYIAVKQAGANLIQTDLANGRWQDDAGPKSADVQYLLTAPWVAPLISGIPYAILASGSFLVNTFASGVLGGGSGTIPSAWGNSGAVTVGQNLDKSGYTASLLSGQLSGFLINLLSGNSIAVWSGTQVNVFSGTNVLVYSGQLSGQPLSLLSGLSYTASGVFTTSVFSGQVYPASGLSVNLLSGNVVRLYSGQQVITSINSDKSGYSLAPAGVDPIQVESGMNLRQAQSVIAAAVAGRLSGAGTTSILLDGANVSGTVRVTAVVDASGNRTSTILTLPT